MRLVEQGFGEFAGKGGGCICDCCAVGFGVGGGEVRGCFVDWFKVHQVSVRVVVILVVIAVGCGSV